MHSISVNNLGRQMSVSRQSNVSSTLKWRWADMRLTSADLDCLRGIYCLCYHTLELVVSIIFPGLPICHRWISVKTHWLFTDWLVIFFVIRLQEMTLDNGWLLCLFSYVSIAWGLLWSRTSINAIGIKALLCETAMIAVTYGLLHCITLTLISLYLWCNISIHVWLRNTLIFRLKNVLISDFK